MIANGIFNRENLENLTSQTINTVRHYASNTYAVIQSESLQSYAKSAAILTITAVFFRAVTFIGPKIASSLPSVAIASTLGIMSGFISESNQSKLEQITIIGIGLLANQILIPAILPFYSLPMMGTIFFNLLAASIVKGNSIYSSSSSI